MSRKHVHGLNSLYKKGAFLSAFAALTVSSTCAFGDQPMKCCKPVVKKSCCEQPLLEAKAGYFFFTDSGMRRVYDEGGIDVQLTGTYPLYRMLNIYGSVEYLEKSGHSRGAHQKTSLWEIPVSLGIQPIFRLGSCVRYYFTIGPRYVFAHAHNHSSFVPKNMHANGIAGFANTGFMFHVWKNVNIDLFGEYSYCRLRFHGEKSGTHRHDVQIGGLTFGGGIGYLF